LERRAKDLVWHHRYSQALPVYESLLHFTPGNLEARFDQAQLYCTLGLCGYEAPAYRELLDRDPFHNLAALALSKQRIRSSPAMEFSSWYWREGGRGDLSRIQRLRSSVSLEVPFFCQYRLKLTGHQWNERPDWSGQSHLAEGYSLEGTGVFNSLLQGEAGYTHRKYRDGRFMDRDTGYGRLSLRLRDDVTVGGGYERTNEIYNEFGIRQGLQADVWSLFAVSYPTRHVDLRGEARYIRFSDDNRGQFASVAAGYAFTDHPRVFKAILSGEYRHSEQESRYLYDGTGRLADILHPYWTPKNYTALGLTLEWRHDLSKLFFCGNDLHFYDVRTSFGTDSESNPYLKLEGEWHYEFRMHWTVGLVGMIHRSRDWRGDSLYATIRYRF